MTIVHPTIPDNSALPPSEHSLSRTQELLLAAIRDQFRESGIPPTLRELSDRTRLAVSTVAYQVGQLEAKGVIRRQPALARSIVVVEPDAA